MIPGGHPPGPFHLSSGMKRQPKPNVELETDPRFPSGKWVGFFTDKRLPGKHQMELQLTFSHGTMTGEGRDRVGKFIIRGRYEVADGQCYWTKSYVAGHDVFYRGFNEGKGIWGSWELTDAGIVCTGGFHIWPEGMADPSTPALAAEAEIPKEEEVPQKREEAIPAGAQARQ